MASFHTAFCHSCGKPYSAAFDPNPVQVMQLCPPCDKAHDEALRAKDVILACHHCGDDVTVLVVMAAEGPTRIATVFCSEACSDCSEDPWEAEHDEEEEVAHVRKPFLLEGGVEALDPSDDDDCPF